MSVEIKVPTLGESVTTATVAKWLKQPGEAVKEDEPIVELETDKVSVEVSASKAGVLGPQVAKEGDEVEVGALLTTLEAGKAGAAPAPAAKPAPEAKQAAPAPAPKAVAASAPAASVTDAAQALPAARKLMAENGLNADTLGQGTGLGGRITKGDVLGFLAQPRAAAPAAAPKPPARTTRVKNA